VPSDGGGVIADDAELLAHLRRHMQRRLQRRHNRNDDRRASAFDPEVEHAERHHRVIARALRLPKRFMEERRRRLDLRRSEPVERPRRHRHDAHLDVGRRIASRHLLAPPALLWWGIADDECDLDHVIGVPLIGVPERQRKG